MVKAYIKIDPRVLAASTNPQTFPFFVPREQSYYWTPEWQKGIRESMAAYEAGDYIEFNGDITEDG